MFCVFSYCAIQAMIRLSVRRYKSYQISRLKTPVILSDLEGFLTAQNSVTKFYAKFQIMCFHSFASSHLNSSSLQYTNVLPQVLSAISA